MPGSPLVVKITDATDINFNSQVDGTYLSMIASGKVSGIVSDNEASVFLLGRHVDSEFWHTVEASVNADGNWQARYISTHSGMLYHPIHFWEFIAIATNKPDNIKKLVNLYSGAITLEDIKKLKSVVCCPSIIRVWSDNVRVDYKIVPRSINYCE